MNKFITKVAKLVLGLSLAAGVGVAVGSKTAEKVNATDVEITASNLVGWNSTQGSQTGSYGGITIESDNAANNTQLRFYSGGTHTFTSSSGNITSAVFTCTANGTNNYGPGKMSGSGYTASSGKTGTWTGNASSFTLTGGQSRVTSIVFTISSGSATYTGVTVSQKTALTGTYKGDAYYECQASVSGTGDYSSTVTWSITSSTTYGSGTSIENKASIDTNGKITFLDNCTVYVWATAADGTTHNTTGFSVVATGLLDNPISSWTLITDDANVSTGNVYALSNDGTYFATTAVSSSKLSLTTTLSSIGYFVLESTSGGYHLRFAAYNTSTDEWEASGKYVNYGGSGTDLASSTTASTVWVLEENSTSGVFLRISGGRHLGINGTSEIKAYANQNIGTNLPAYLYEVGSLPVIDCDTIQLTGKPSGDMSIGDTATLGYYALDGSANEWTGDVTYTISNEKDPSNNTTTGVVELSATSGVSVTLTAKKPGSARVSVQDDAGNATPDYVDVTVLADPERIDLPVGDYSVTISISGSGATIPETTSHEIKAKEGRTWYKNLVLNYTDVSNSYNNEYTMTKSTGVISTTNNSNAVITTVEVDYYQYENATMYVGATPISSTAGTNSANTNSLMKVYTINAQNFSLKNEDASHAQSFYSLKINFQVIDENEEFLSLVVSKSAGWSTATNGTYKDGDSPTNSGLVATANFTTDGETISRSEDVTSLVSNWTYNPATLSTGDTSFTVVATWSGHSSASFTVSNISVTAITGPIPSGRYYIMNSDKTFGLNAEASASASPATVNLGSANQLTAFDVILKADNEYEISVTIETVKYYLVCNTTATSSNNTSIRITSSPSGSLKSTHWSLDDTSVSATGAYHVGENTTGSYTRYLSCYSETDWRGYLNTSNGDPEIQFVSEGSYAEAIADSLLNDLTCNNGSTAPSTSVWGNISSAYGSITIAHEKALLTGGTANENSEDTVEQALAKYDYVVGKYLKGQGLTAYNDFLGRDPAQIGGARVLLSNVTKENTNTVAIIVIISLVSVTAIGGYFFLKKRREQN